MQWGDGMPPVGVAGQHFVEPGGPGESGAFDLVGQLAGGQAAAAGLGNQLAQVLLQLAGLLHDGTLGDAFVQVQSEGQGLRKQVEQSRLGHGHSCACTGNSLMTSASGGRSVKTAMVGIDHEVGGVRTALRQLFRWHRQQVDLQAEQRRLQQARHLVQGGDLAGALQPVGQLGTVQVAFKGQVEACLVRLEKRR
ncbi:hypothetical protein D3C81_770090 [compost metagenome]